MPVPYTRKSPAWQNGDVVSATDAERWEQGHTDAAAFSQASMLGASPSGVVRYLGAVGVGRSGNVGAANLNRLYAVPLRIDMPVQVDRLALNIDAAGTTGAVWRLGLYGSTSTGLPGSLLIDAGTVAATTTGQREASFTALTLSRGLWWAVGAPQVAASGGDRIQGAAGWMHRGHGDNFGTFLADFGGLGWREFAWYMDGVTGALPSTFSTTPTSAREAPNVAVRLTGA
jgi:hypothetical protein